METSITSLCLYATLLWVTSRARASSAWVSHTEIMQQSDSGLLSDSPLKATSKVKGRLTEHTWPVHRQRGQSWYDCPLRQLTSHDRVTPEFNVYAIGFSRYQLSRPKAACTFSLLSLRILTADVKHNLQQSKTILVFVSVIELQCFSCNPSSL
jgi:hypothetical protein